MSIGILNLTTQMKSNISHLIKKGWVKQDNQKLRLYKYFVKLDFAEIFWEPHKFNPLTNWGIPHTKVNIHSKHFDRFEVMKDYLFELFPNHIDIELNQFNVSRIEIHSDIDNFPLDTVLARLWVMGYRRESISFYKGNSIYIGTNPKIRIFNKSKQILNKVAKGKPLSKIEKTMLKGNGNITRFSMEIRNFGRSLEDDENINRLGGFQLLMSKVRREHRKTFERFKDRDLEKAIKQNFLSSIDSWFKEEKKKKNSFDLDKEINRQFNKLIKALIVNLSQC
jgi:hypothetical protein